MQRQSKKAKLFKKAQEESDELKKVILIARWKKTKSQLNQFKSQLESINVDLKDKKYQLKKLSEESAEKRSVLNELNNKKRNFLSQF